VTAHALAAELTGMPGVLSVRATAPLASYTTFRTGGPADALIEVSTEAALETVLARAAAAAVPVTLLGGGSNVLIADAGVRGLVVRARLTDLDQPRPDVVRAGAGVTINGLVRWTIGRGLQALEAWAGTPGTVGGAIYGNAHYGGRNIGDLVQQVRVVAARGRSVNVPRDEMGFAYDTSRLQRTREVVVWAEFAVSPGHDAEALRGVARASLAHRKRTQPLDVPSAGCVFQNPDPARDVVPAGIPLSAGALVDRAGFKGHRIGGAMISPVHGNFIVNDAGATSADIAALIDAARDAVRDRFGVSLRDEVVRIGF
jgi:UDP-N-acetylmuramate dehydrogenase